MEHFSVYDTPIIRTFQNTSYTLLAYQYRGYGMYHFLSLNSQNKPVLICFQDYGGEEHDYFKVFELNYIKNSESIPL